MSFKKITLNELTSNKDAFNFFKEWAVTLVQDGDKVNPMTIGWGSLGILWRKPCCTVYINKVRYSKQLFDEQNLFSVSIFDMQKYKKELTQFGTLSGRDNDKTFLSGFILNYYENIPYYEEAEVVILCKKMGQTDFDINQVYEPNIKEWYLKDGVHTIYFGEIIGILKKN